LEKIDSVQPIQDEAIVINTLANLNEIGASINRLGKGQDLLATLRLIAQGAVRAVAASADPASSLSNASAVMWIYDQAGQSFDPARRVSAGEPAHASPDDYPRSDGLGWEAVRRRQRLLSYEENDLTIHPAKEAAGARSLVCYPLIVNDEIVGLLYIYRCDDRRFNEIELLTLDNFVNMAAMAIHYERKVLGLNRALVKKVGELETISRASQLISSRTNLDEMLQEILSIGLEITGAQYGSFELYDKRKNVLTINALAGRKMSTASAPSLPVDEHSVVGRVASSRQSLLIDDLRDPRWQSIYQPLPADREMRSELAIPLIGAGTGVEGVLNLESPVTNAFTKEDQHLLETLATQVVIALQEMRLLDAMHEIGEVLLTAEPDELFRLIIERACDLINVSGGSIWTISDTNTLVLRQSTEGYRPGEQLPLDRSLTGQAIRLRQPVTIDNVQEHPDFLYRQLAVEQGWVSAIIVPLMMPDESRRALGSFSLYAHQLRDFSNWDKKLLTFLANHAAVAIQNAEQLVQLKQAQERQAIAETFAAVGDVAANLLHQVNNKVGAISPRVQGIEDKCAQVVATSPYLARNLREIEQSARQAMDIVRDSMAHLRPAKPQPVNIADCLERALQRAAPPPSVDIVRAGLEHLPRARASEQQLELVFYNLIDNALKAMAGPGELHITGDWQEDEVSITITDTGPGISPAIQPHIFEFSPTSKLPEDSHTRRLGFGLWWVKKFVDRFGGQLILQSEPGQGTTFTVRLPAEREM
jgi:GAF domain-containing protein